VTLEFLMARQLLQLPIYTWRKEHSSGDPRPLVLDYTVVIRSLDRIQAKYWHRPWRVRWDSMLENPAVERIHSVGASRSGDNPIDVMLSDSRWIGLVMDEPPSARPVPRTAPEVLTTVLRAGRPVILRHPTARQEDLHALVGQLAGVQAGVLDLPGQQRVARPSANVGDLVRDLAVLPDYLGRSSPGRPGDSGSPGANSPLVAGEPVENGALAQSDARRRSHSADGPMEVTGRHIQGDASPSSTRFAPSKTAGSVLSGTPRADRHRY
jgi:vWA-MoxR associated protein C-terminal domain